MDPNFYVVLITEGASASKDQMQESLQSLLKVNEDTASKLVANPFTVIKRHINFESAQKLARVVESAGCRCEIVEEGKDFVPPDGDEADDNDNDTTVMF